MIDLHQDQPDYAKPAKKPLEVPHTLEALPVFTPAMITEAYIKGGMIESDERVDYFRDDKGELQSRPHSVSVRHAIDQMFERDRAKQEREQWTFFKFD